MALIQHKNIQARFQQQVDNAQTYLIPFIEEAFPLKAGMHIMEIGCGEGGVLKPFVERDMICLGVDLAKSRIENARELQAEAVAQKKAEFLAQNVYDEDFKARFSGHFDLILLKDTIEHIPAQETFIPYLAQFLKPGGMIFFGFPPWYMPFGGHQQICQSKVLGLLPYFHLLPYSLYKGILKLGGESAQTIEDLIEIKDTGISISRFESILSRTGYVIARRTLFFINPIYRYKFGLKPRKQAKWITYIPFFRDFVSTAGWYLVHPQK